MNSAAPAPQSGGMRPEDRLAALLEAPGRQALDDYVSSLDEVSDRLRRTVGFQRRLRTMARRLLWHYARTGEDFAEEALQKTDVTFSGILAANEWASLVRYRVRHPFSHANKALRLLASKCDDPGMAARQARRRAVRKLWTLVKKPFRAVSAQLQYKKYGYTKSTLSAWRRLKRRDRAMHPQADRALVRRCHRAGYLLDRVDQYGPDHLTDYVSDRDDILLNPRNNSYRKWIGDIVSQRVCLDGKKKYFPKAYYQILHRDKNRLLIRLPDCPAGYGANDLREVLRLLREGRVLRLEPAQYASDALTRVFQWEDGVYWYKETLNAAVDRMRALRVVTDYFSSFDEAAGEPDRIEISEEELLALLRNAANRSVIREEPRTVHPGIHRMRAVILNRSALDPKILELNLQTTDGEVLTVDPQSGRGPRSAIPDWDRVREQLTDLCGLIAHLEYYAVHFVVTETGLCVVGFSVHPVRLTETRPNEEQNAYLSDELARVRGRKRQIVTVARLKKLRWKLFTRLFCRPGYQEFFLHEYVTSVLHDLFTFRGTTLRQKLWCYRRGYYSYHLAQYGLTEDNWRDFVSDRDYHWLSPINCSYFQWIDDKTTYRYVMEPCRQYVPEYYYHLITRNGELRILRLQDCPQTYSADFDGILRLIRDRGKLACKQSSGTHGDGFFKLSWEEGTYRINNEPASEEDIRTLLSGFSCFYDLTEYLEMHEELCKIYGGCVNTIRVMVINRDGASPKMMNAYMRIGSVSTGLTDNVGYGGVFCRVDVDTGRFHDAEQAVDHVIVPCPRHPDTGALIEGTVPLWDQVCEAVREIALTVPQLEYLGFDVAVTTRGVQVLEVNKHQDLHRCFEYGPEIQGFFREKIENKKKKYGIAE